MKIRIGFNGSFSGLLYSSGESLAYLIKTVVVVNLEKMLQF